MQTIKSEKWRAGCAAREQITGQRRLRWTSATRWPFQHQWLSSLIRFQPRIATHRSLCTRTPYLSLAVRLGIAMPLTPSRLSSERPVSSTWSPTRMHSFDLSAIAMPWLSGRTSRLQRWIAIWPPFDKSTPSRPERRPGVTVPVCPFIPAVLRPLRTTCSPVPYADFWTRGRTRLWSQMSCFTTPRPEEIQSTCKSSKPACCANTFIACSGNSSSKPLSLVRTSTTRAHEFEADCDIWSEKGRWRARQISTRGPSAGTSQDPVPRLGGHCREIHNMGMACTDAGPLRNEMASMPATQTNAIRMGPGTGITT